MKHTRNVKPIGLSPKVDILKRYVILKIGSEKIRILIFDYILLNYISDVENRAPVI